MHYHASYAPVFFRFFFPPAAAWFCCSVPNWCITRWRISCCWIPAGCRCLSWLFRGWFRRSREKWALRHLQLRDPLLLFPASVSPVSFLGSWLRYNPTLNADIHIFRFNASICLLLSLLSAILSTDLLPPLFTAVVPSAANCSATLAHAAASSGVYLADAPSASNLLLCHLLIFPWLF